MSAVLHVNRVSAKLFNCTPANLPLDMKQNLIHLLGRGINSMEGYIRPGCVHVTLNAITNVQPDSDEPVTPACLFLNRALSS